VSNKRRTPPYFAVARSVFDHPLFVKHPEWFLPWAWLISHAAYKPRVDRLGLAIADVARGQLVTTVRGLAQQWSWPTGNVQYFLKVLRGQGMITCLAIRTRIHTAIESRKSQRATLITICNYDKFQPIGRMGRVGHQADNFDVGAKVVSQDLAQAVRKFGETAVEQNKPTGESFYLLNQLDLGEVLGLQPVTYGDKSSTTAHIPKPPHGIKTPAKKNGAQWQWFDHGTPEWKASKESDEAEHPGVTIMPKRYKGGWGNWFRRRTPEAWKAWGKAVAPLAQPTTARDMIDSAKTLRLMHENRNSSQENVRQTVGIRESLGIVLWERR
jgi:hypothetical protein